MSDFQGLGWLGASKMNGSHTAYLNQPGKWTWLSGKAWDFTDWKPGEPSNKTHKPIKRVSTKYTKSIYKELAENQKHNSYVV